ncbi:peptidase inhibitor family I36 protein [Polyangium jinanense]|uniref:Peptidase inhibitor family I36 protein n=1 Tax=Polyangium jinanense TaxID=2829994 RepID=A0A9X4B008_9BACT|nr:peptidase inhibitor family I36 protein [Polyangium jinanense]MDC3988702.1 peptidase inhibitor family I36 protein [Polyangium jinanense]
MKTVWMGLVACGALGLAAQAQAQTCAHMFRNVNFGGDGVVAQDGDLVANIGSRWNDRVSSVTVEEDCFLQVYENVNFGGETTVLVSDVPDLMDWKNRISSYECICNSPGPPPRR